MKNKLLVWTLLLSAGALGYLIHNEHIIILFPETYSLESTSSQSKPSNISLYTWNQNGTYSKETISLMFTNTKRKNIEQIVKKWLLAQEYQTIPVTTLKNAALSFDEKDLFINFSSYPFNRQASIYAKLSWIQGLFKTIKEYNASIEHVYFLAQQKTLTDYELDFSHAWPIEGFLE